MGAATRHYVADMLAADGTQAIVLHFPFPGIGTITRDGNGFVWLPALMFEG